MAHRMAATTLLADKTQTDSAQPSTNPPPTPFFYPPGVQLSTTSPQSPLLGHEMCALEGLADEEARQDAGDGRHEDDEPEVGGRGQHIVKQVVDVAAPLQGQGPVHDEVQDPEGCAACRLSMCRAWAARISRMPQRQECRCDGAVRLSCFSDLVLMHVLSRQAAS